MVTYFSELCQSTDKIEVLYCVCNVCEDNWELCSKVFISGYWESLQQQLKAHMARTRLRERHQDELRRKLFRLKQEARLLLFIGLLNKILCFRRLHYII